MSRLLIFNDPVIEGSFIFRTEKEKFARADKCAGKWRIWLYGLHTQRSFLKLREAASFINEVFISKAVNEIY